MTHDLNGPTRRDPPPGDPRIWFYPARDGQWPAESPGTPAGWRDRTLGPIHVPPGPTLREGGGPLLGAFVLIRKIKRVKGLST